MVISKEDEWIVQGEVAGRHDLCREVAGAGESRREWWNGDNASNATLLQHD
jgi:hypothetical protein